MDLCPAPRGPRTSKGPAPPSSFSLLLQCFYSAPITHPVPRARSDPGASSPQQWTPAAEFWSLSSLCQSWGVEREKWGVSWAKLRSSSFSMAGPVYLLSSELRLRLPGLGPAGSSVYCCRLVDWASSSLSITQVTFPSLSLVILTCT